MSLPTELSFCALVPIAGSLPTAWNSTPPYAIPQNWPLDSHVISGVQGLPANFLSSLSSHLALPYSQPGNLSLNAAGALLPAGRHPARASCPQSPRCHALVTRWLCTDPWLLIPCGRCFFALLCRITFFLAPAAVSFTCFLFQSM